MRRQLIAVTLVTGIAQVAGFAKLWVTARLFGVSAELDGYNLALVAPTLISGILSAMLQTGLFPVRARLAVEQDADMVAAFERSVLLGLLLVGGCVSLALWILQPIMEPWVAPGASPVMLASLRIAWPITVLLVTLNAVGDGLASLLAMRNRYIYAAAAPVANALLGVAILLAWPEGRVMSLATSTSMGLGVQVLLCLWALRRTGFNPFDSILTWSETRQDWREMLRLGAWILPGAAFSNLTLTLPNVLLATRGEGAVAAFGYAQRLHFQATQLLVMAASPLLLARLSELVARREEQTIARLLAKAAIVAAIIGAAAALFVWAAGALILEWIFGGRFDSAAAERVGLHWLLLTLGLAPAIWGNVFAKLWQARKRSAQLSMLSGMGLVVFVVIGWASSERFGELAIPAALTCSAFSVSLVSWYLERR